jgi:hypothetical protein
MSRVVRIAALQPAYAPPAPGQEPEAARAEALCTGAALIEEAGRRGATVACLPECFPTMALPGAAAARLA